MAMQGDRSRQRAAGEFASNTVVDVQRRYIQAWQDAGQIMLDAMQTVARRQAELAEEGMRDLWSVAADDGRAASAARRSEGQADRLQGLYQRAFGAFQELSEIMLKAQSEAMRTLVEGVAASAETARKAA